MINIVRKPATGPSPAPATRAAPWDYAAPWGARGYVTDLRGPVHWIEFSPKPNGQTPGPSESETPGPSQGPRPPIVFVHGLGGSHLNWCLIGPHLAAGRRAVALDLRGFGLTPGLPSSSTVQANARLVDLFITEVIGAPVILVGNSMGGLISIMETAANKDVIKGLVLIDPACIITDPAETRLAGHRPVPALRAARAGRAGRREAAGERLTGRSRPAAPPAVLRRAVQGRPYDDQDRGGVHHRRPPATPAQALAHARIFLAAARSLLRITARRGQYVAMMAGIDIPVLLIGGDADRLVPAAAMRQAAARNPHWESVILAGVGHTPQLEVPEAVTGAIQDWLDRHAT